MAHLAMDDVLRFLRHACGNGGGDKTDAELLESYLAHEEVAFSMLVQRHGPMVLGICRRLSADFHAAEDGFQATFMVLARRAASIRKKKSITAWLHGVARRTALKARAKAARVPDPRLRERSSANPLEELTTRELRMVVDEEIAQLPEKYQTPILLCYFEGKSHDQAAKALGCPKNTVTNRLARARELLRARLERRGITLAVGVLATTLTEIGAAPPLPAFLAINTVKAATLLASGKAVTCGCLSATALALAEETVAGMFWLKAKVVVMMLAIGLALGGTGWVKYKGFAESARQPVVLNTETKSSNDQVVTAPKEDQVVTTDQLGDPLPTGALARVGSTRLRHDRQVGFASFLPDGKRVVTVGDDLTIRVWEFPSGKEIRRISLAESDRFLLTARSNQTFFSAAALSRDGQTIATCFNQSKIRIHDVNSEKELPGLELEDGELRLRVETGKAPTKGGEPIKALAFLPAGQTLAVLNHDGSVFLWDFVKKQQVRNFVGLNKIGRSPNTMTIAPDGKSIALFDIESPSKPDPKALRQRTLDPQALRLWSLINGSEICTISKENFYRTSPAFSPDGKVLAFSSRYNGATLADTATGKEIMDLKGRPLEFWRMVFSKDGTKLYSRARGYRQVKEWDVADGKLLRTLQGEGNAQSGQYLSSSMINDSLSLSPDGKTLLLTGVENAPQFLDIASGKEIADAIGHAKPIVALRFSPDGKRLLTQDPAIRQWDTQNGKDLGGLNLPSLPMQLAVNPDGKIAAGWSMSEKGNISPLAFYDTASGEVLGTPAMSTNDTFWPVVFSGDGKRLAVHSFEEMKIDIYEVPSGKRLHVLQMGTDFPKPNGFDLLDYAELWHMMASPDGKILACLANLNSLLLWDITTGKRVGVLQLPTREPNKNRFASEFRPLQTAAFSPDSRYLAVNLQDDSVLVFELATLQARSRIGKAYVPQLGRKDTSGNRIGLHMTDTGSQMQPGPSVAFSPDCKTLAQAGLDQAVHLWDLATGKELAAFKGQSGALTAVAFSPDGKLVASASWDTTAMIWDVSKVNRSTVPAITLTPEQLNAHWRTLTDSDADKGFAAICALSTDSKVAIALIKQQIKPAPPVDLKHIDNLIA